MAEKTLICVDCLRRPVCTGYRAVLQPTEKGECPHYVKKERPNG